ncbi:E3 ubiquitin-protein ligase TRIM39-like isoform X1 [Anguilla anguilla]|uniref:E3 ubiquitin-protein ligase TRIM39-like isoform X1 n=2 Tax=Anguilla anguilla TaxID=7936 RepID=UPI0015AD0A05|nr:E3 ubiquitin-protein ligase TRIM39-like isoform X1 [Anguilla anguilla]
MWLLKMYNGRLLQEFPDQTCSEHLMHAAHTFSVRPGSAVAMASSRSFLSEEQFLCSICLDVFSNPVSTPCGHSFCKTCIGGYWDAQSKLWQCPLCKESFRKRPELHINRTLREITEQFKRMSGGGTAVGGAPVGSLPVGGTAVGGAPVGSLPVGWVPVGGAPVGSLPVGGIPVGGVPVGGVPGGGVSVGGASEERPHRPGELPGNLFAEMRKRFLRPSSSEPQAPPPAPSSSAPSSAPPTETTSLPALALRRYTLSDIRSHNPVLSQSSTQSHSPTPYQSPIPTHNPVPSQSSTQSDSPTPYQSPTPSHFSSPSQCSTHSHSPSPSQILACYSNPAPSHSPAPEAPPPGSGLGPRRYTLSGPADSLDTPLCPRHGQRLELFCRAEQECVCAACMETMEHHGHTAVPAKREWLIKKSQLSISEAELQDLIRDRERKVEEIRASIMNMKTWAERETEGSVRAFSALVSSVERCQAELLEVIEMNRRVAERQAEGVIQELEQEIGELKKRCAALTHLVQSEDHMLFLRNFPTLCIPPHTKDWSQVSVTSDLMEGSMLRTLSQLVERCQEELRKLPELSLRPPAEHSLLRHQPKVKRMQEYAVDVTLDPSTAHPRLILSDDRKQVKCGERHQPVPDCPERFDRVVCVLGQQGFTGGRHYWEVEVGGKTDWDLGVASHSVNRKGKITVSPAHGYWFLSLRDKSEYAFRTDPSTSLGLAQKPRRIGIYLDYQKGQVSFYNVDARLHIYTFIDSFTDTIHPFFSPCTNKSGKNEAPLIISPIAHSD